MMCVTVCSELAAIEKALPLFALFFVDIYIYMFSDILLKNAHIFKLGWELKPCE